MVIPRVHASRAQIRVWKTQSRASIESGGMIRFALGAVPALQVSRSELLIPAPEAQ